MRSPEELVSAFEACELSLDQFHHREHLTAALWYGRLYSHEEALSRMRTGLQRLLHANGKPATAYCEETTRFWMAFASSFAQEADIGQPFASLLRDFLQQASLLPHKRVEETRCRTTANS